MAHRSCLNCTNVLLGETTQYCEVYGERIIDWSSAAADCPSYNAWEPNEIKEDSDVHQD